MVSLTTVYIVSVLLSSIAGIGSAFAGNRMVGGSIATPEPAPSPTPVPVSSTAQTTPAAPLPPA